MCHWKCKTSDISSVGTTLVKSFQRQDHSQFDGKPMNTTALYHSCCWNYNGLQRYNGKCQFVLGLLEERWIKMLKQLKQTATVSVWAAGATMTTRKATTISKNNGANVLSDWVTVLQLDNEHTTEKSHNRILKSLPKTSEIHFSQADWATVYVILIANLRRTANYNWNLKSQPKASEIHYYGSKGKS